MKTPRQDSRMQDLINWKKIMPMPRDAGGHDGQMKRLFRGAKVLAHWNEDEYRGCVATAVRLKDGTIAVYQDSYGSCSGCDAWVDASDADVKILCRDLANGAYLFDSVSDAVEWLLHSEEPRYGGEWKREIADILQTRGITTKVPKE